MQLWDKKVFSYKDTQIQYSVSNHIRFTAKLLKILYLYKVWSWYEAIPVHQTSRFGFGAIPNYVFSYKDTQIQYSVSNHIRFTAKNNKLLKILYLYKV